MRKYFTIFIKIRPKQVTKNQIYVKEHGYMDDIVFESYICSPSMIPPENAYLTLESKSIHWSKSRYRLAYAKAFWKYDFVKLKGTMAIISLEHRFCSEPVWKLEHYITFASSEKWDSKVNANHLPHSSLGNCVQAVLYGWVHYILCWENMINWFMGIVLIDGVNCYLHAGKNGLLLYYEWLESFN